LGSEEPLAGLTSSELEQLCDWVSGELGGAANGACDVGTVEIPNVICEGVPPSCVALVAEVEACAREQRAALEACEVGEDGPACARLARLCPVVGTIEPGTVTLGGCTTGEARACTCADGAQGAQTCNMDELWDACACESVPMPPAVCTPGETVLCACTDGAMGAQTCVNGTWGPCACASPTLCLPGETRGCACASGVAGAQLCDASGREWLPCECAPPSGTCNADFCPAPGGATPCCVTVNGPCGQDFGMGCLSPMLPGAD
jgi:hypothetical protein